MKMHWKIVLVVTVLSVVSWCLFYAVQQSRWRQRCEILGAPNGNPDYYKLEIRPDGGTVRCNWSDPQHPERIPVTREMPKFKL